MCKRVEKYPLTHTLDKVRPSITLCAAARLLKPIKRDTGHNWPLISSVGASAAAQLHHREWMAAYRAQTVYYTNTNRQQRTSSVLHKHKQRTSSVLHKHKQRTSSVLQTQTAHYTQTEHKQCIVQTQTELKQCTTQTQTALYTQTEHKQCIVHTQHSLQYTRRA